ncbi:MAG TPA: DUF2341 domain-containing protein, partial [Steroidobacteraceae bacterium]|nr:DUF2341 domain-containing protein [Steroidobacteraceae bacterium]
MWLALCVLLVASVGVSHAAAPAGSWWNTSYPFRYKISIGAGPSALASSYSVSITTFDHADAVTVGRSLASGNDVRIVYWNGSTWVELNRVLDPQSSWNTSAPQLWFRTQTNIAASATNDNYYLYFGNVSTAGAPPADASLVFPLFDDFNGSSLSASLWNQSGTSVSSGVLTLPVSAWIRSVATFGQNTMFESSLRLPS